MKEIRTIKNSLENAATFDAEVNRALAEGWRLVRRDVLAPYVATVEERTNVWSRLLYAELEREVEAEDETAPNESAEWELSGHPSFPYECSACHTQVPDRLARCPWCHRLMENAEGV